MSARRSIIPVFVPHLGCPNACVFCNQNEITGTAAEEAFRQMNRVISMPPEGGARELAFYGGSFTAIPETQQLKLLTLAKTALQRGCISSIRLSTRPDAVSPEILERLRQYGVGTVELGAQSMQDNVLRASGRGHTAEDVRQAARLVLEYGFQLVLQMMTGLPGDDDDGALHTAAELIALKPHAVRIYPTVIVRGTELEKMWRCGQYQEHTVEDAVRVCSRLLPLFEKAGIAVIRLGLNPTEDLSGGAALAGAYHPALGELVRSRVLRNAAEEKLEELQTEGKTVVIHVPPGLVSQMIGQKRCYLIWLQERFSLQRVKVMEEPGLKEPGFELIDGGQTMAF